MAQDAPVIRTTGLTKAFGSNVAVDGLTMEVRRGKVYGLLGPNGSGKTTTMAMILGLLRPTSGTFRLFDSDAPHTASLRRIGAVIESPALYPYMTARENLTYFQRIVGRRSPNEVESLLDLVGLAHRADSKFRTYSLGMKQRLSIAYALIGDPEIICLDEPTNGLDPEGIIEVRQLIRNLGDGRRTVLLSSHLLHEVEQVCDSVTILAKGRLIAQGDVAELVSQNRKEQIRVNTTDNVVAQDFLRAIPWIESVEVQPDAILLTTPLENAGRVTASLAGNGVYITEMTPVQVSLEEYFLEVTQQ